MKPLTQRQAELTSLLAQGMSAKEIADELGVAVTTAQTMLQQARERVGAKNVAHLVAISISRGFINALCVCLIVSMICQHGDAMRRIGAKRPTRRNAEIAIVV